MFGIGNPFRVLGTLWNRFFPLCIMGVLGAFSSNSFAQVTPLEPTDLGDIVFPINLASIATVVATAGATMIGLWAVYKIGFKLVRKFISRMGSTV